MDVVAALGSVVVGTVVDGPATGAVVSTMWSSVSIIRIGFKLMEPVGKRSKECSGSDVERVNSLGSNFNYTWVVESLSKRVVGRWNAEMLTVGATGLSISVSMLSTAGAAGGSILIISISGDRGQLLSTAGAAGRSTISADLVISSLVNLPLLSRDHCMHYSCEQIEYIIVEEKLS